MRCPQCGSINSDTRDECRACRKSFVQAPTNNKPYINANRFLVFNPNSPEEMRYAMYLLRRKER